MVTATATVNLRSFAPSHQARPTFLSLLLRLEAWLDNRAGRNALYSMDERALHDIGLTSADVEGFDRTTIWQNCLMGPAGRR
jgi:uncharacterized protein YjiS (DUF1127 family)